MNSIDAFRFATGSIRVVDNVLMLKHAERRSPSILSPLFAIDELKPLVHKKPFSSPWHHEQEYRCISYNLRQTLDSFICF